MKSKRSEPLMEKIASQVLALVQKKGIKTAEVFLLDSRELTIEVAQQEVENLKLAEEKGIGLRVIAQNRLGYAYSADLRAAALQKMVEKAVTNAALVAEDPAWYLAEPAEAYPQLDLYDAEIEQKDLAEKIALAQAVEQAALAADTRVKQVEKAVYQDSLYQVSLYNSLGLQGNYQGSFCGLFGVAIGRDSADAQTGYSLNYSLKYQDLKPAQLGREAAEKAVRMLGAQMMPSAKIPVVFPPEVMTGILGVLEAVFSGEAILKGTSFLMGQEGQKIASPLVKIVDHGLRPQGLGSVPFDSEGIPPQKTVLIENGELQGFLHNLYTARKLGHTSTGNAVRASYRSTPGVGITNFYLEPGTLSPQELLGEINSGLYVTDVMGLHTANPISGDFSLGAAGLLIEKGELTKPVKGIALAGNLRDLLRGIEAIATDLTFYLQRGAPTVQVGGLTISGS